MNKRGQFFLVAALIASSLLFGLTTVINSAQSTGEDRAFYGLSDEIDFETKRVLDYGTYYYEHVSSDQLMREFLTEYADYIAQEKVLFLYGNANSLEGLYFSNRAIGSIGVGTGGGATIIPIQQVSGSVADVRVEGDRINVVIGGVTYPFTLLEGQNFFFVIIKERDQEAYVATN